MSAIIIVKGPHVLWTTQDDNGKEHNHFGITVMSQLPKEECEDKGYLRQWDLNCKDLITNRKDYATYFGMTQEDFDKLCLTFPTE